MQIQIILLHGFDVCISIVIITDIILTHTRQICVCLSGKGHINNYRYHDTTVQKCICLSGKGHINNYRYHDTIQNCICLYEKWHINNYRYHYTTVQICISLSGKSTLIITDIPISTSRTR